MEKAINIIIIDDHEMVLQGLSSLLNGQPGLNIIGEYTNGNDAVSASHQLDIDIVLTDINMPILNGFETAKRLLSVKHELKIIMLSMENKEAYVDKAREEGIAAYVTKDVPIQKLISVIKKVYLNDIQFEFVQ